MRYVVVRLASDTDRRKRKPGWSAVEEGVDVGSLKGDAQLLESLSQRREYGPRVAQKNHDLSMWESGSHEVST